MHKEPNFTPLLATFLKIPSKDLSTLLLIFKPLQTNKISVLKFSSNLLLGSINIPFELQTGLPFKLKISHIKI